VHDDAGSGKTKLDYQDIVNAGSFPGRRQNPRGIFVATAPTVSTGSLSRSSFSHRVEQDRGQAGHISLEMKMMRSR